MEIFKKKKLLCFLFLFFAFIPFINVKADFNINLKNGEHVVLPDKPEDGYNTFFIFKSYNNNNYYLFSANHEYKDLVMVQSFNTNNFELGFKHSQGSSATGNQVKQYSYNSKNYTWDLIKDTTCTGACFYNTSPYIAKQLLYSSVNVVSNRYTITVNDINANFNIGIYNAGDIMYIADTLPIISLEEKKKFLYNNDEMNNPMRYIDLYFDKEDFGKEINFELKLEDFFNYSSCEYCEYLDIDKFVFSYLIKDDNGLYKWVDYSNLDTGLYFDYTGETFPRNEDGTGLTLNGKINLNFDTSIYNFERIRASIKLNNGYNFSYTYSDDSNISAENIDEYYHYMTYNYGERLNRIEGGSTKYTILSTTKDNLNGSLVVQYINTDKWLYAEYFDTFNHTYLENSNLFQEHYLMGDKDLAISKFTIGKNSNRGIYLMNYLYQKDDKNLNSKYYFYIPTEVSYSTTDFLDEGLYYDNDGNFNSSITPNPNYETDNLRFIDNFRGIFNFLNDLQTTSNTFNYMWNSFYNTMPIIFQSFLKFATHILCLLIFMKIVGYE